MPLINELSLLIDQFGHVGINDRIDYLCEGIIRESILTKNSVSADPKYKSMLLIRDQIKREYNTDPNVAKLAHKCGMSQSSFRRCWARHFGIPPKRYIIEFRIEKACRYLINSDQTIKDISYAVGFNDPLYFSKAFRQRTGMSPSDFRAQRS